MKVEPGYYIKLTLDKEEANTLCKALETVNHNFLSDKEVDFIEKLHDYLLRR